MGELTFRGFTRPTYTMVPDQVFDELLPHLREAELKVLLYIIRRTFGFKKESDPISFNQFLNGITTKDGRVLDKGCGLSDRTSLSRALQDLEAKGIIETQKRTDEKGEKETTVYGLCFVDMGVVGGPYHPSRQSIPGVVGEPYPQQTVSQETVKQETEQQHTQPREPEEAKTQNPDRSGQDVVAPKNLPEKKDENPQAENEGHPQEHEAVEALEALVELPDMNPKVARELALKCDPSLVLDTVAKVKRKEEVLNPAGYVVTCLKNGYEVTDPEEAKEKAVLRRKALDCYHDGGGSCGARWETANEVCKMCPRFSQKALEDGDTPTDPGNDDGRTAEFRRAIRSCVYHRNPHLGDCVSRRKGWAAFPWCEYCDLLE